MLSVLCFGESVGALSAVFGESQLVFSVLCFGESQ